MPARSLAVLAAALVLPGTALAKGPAAASVSGTGLDRAVAVQGHGEDGGASLLGRLVESSGFFPLTFGQSPDPTTRARPAGDLGPSVRITWRVPGPSGRTDTLVQDVYPWADVPVSYMASGQRFFDGRRSHGGWLVGADGLKPVLVELGVPESAPVAGGDSGLLGIDGAWLALAAAGVLALVLAAAGALVVARRPHTA
jgi:hypothetical protein